MIARSIGLVCAVLAVTSGCWVPDPDTVTIKGKLFGFVSRAPLDNVHVCVVDHPELACDDTDAGGHYQLRGVAKDTDYILETTREDLYPALRMLRASAETESMVVTDFQLTPFEAENLAFLAHAKLSTATGALTIYFNNMGIDNLPRTPGVPGVSVAISPEAGVEIYGGMMGPDPSLETTTTFGRAGYLELPPGEYELEYLHPMMKCRTPAYRWKGREGGSARVEVRAGYHTITSGVCAPF